MNRLLLLLGAILASAGALDAAKPDVAEKQTIVPMSQRLSEAIAPRIEYREASLPDIVAQITKTSKDLDPNQVGVQFVLSPAAKRSEARITLTLKNVPLLEVVKYVTSLANLKYQLTAEKVFIKTLDEK